MKKIVLTMVLAAGLLSVFDVGRPGETRGPAPRATAQQSPARPPSVAAPGDLELSVGGAVQVVKRKRVIEVLDDWTVAKGFPVEVKVPGADAKGLFFWQLPPGVTFLDRGPTISVTAAPKGDLTVSVKIVSPDLDEQGRWRGWKNQFGTTTFSIGDAPGPGPGPQPPPGPTPDPVDPSVSTSPFTEPGLRMLASYDEDVNRPPGQNWIYGPSKDVRDWLNAHCVPGPPDEKDGQGQVMREWRIWPSRTVPTAARKVFRDAWQNKGPEKKDWLMIGDGKVGWSGPLPKTEAEALAIFAKFGGK